ncbi:MAG: hypothetical protein JWO56_1848 [Acidobacteria bacterium]|nr:hypothetical protein [Acidobacteriota bacterium]
MASEIKEPLLNTVVATGNNAVAGAAAGTYTIGNIAPYPNESLNGQGVGNSFRVKDTGLFPNGVLLELTIPPGGGMQTATFTRPAVNAEEQRREE